MKNKIVKWLFSASLLFTIVTAGCAQAPDASADPFEHFNRVIFTVNRGIDYVVLKPIATVYTTLTPGPLQAGVTNVFANIDEISTFPNDFLQGNFKCMAVDFWRFMINSTVGVGGLFDVATRIGIQPHVETFGLTLAKWRGGKSAPYLVLPLFGPSTVQMAVGNVADYYMTFWPYLPKKYRYLNYTAHGLKFINIRAQLLPTDRVINTAFDPYVFVRDAYLQRLTQQIAANQTLGK